MINTLESLYPSFFWTTRIKYRRSNMKEKLKKSENLESKNWIKLHEGFLYNPVKDSYLITHENPEELGPISVGFQVTRRCNANCVHCAASDMIPDLPTEKVFEILEKLKAGGCVRVCVTGGEPLVRNDLMDILKKIKELGMNATLSTNGLALNRQKLKEMKPYLTNIRFSLHGLKETNDKIFQRKGAYEKIMSQIEACVEEGMSVGVIYSAMKRNVDELVELAHELEERGVGKITIFTLIANGRAIDLFDKQLVPASEIEKTLKKLKKLKKEKGWDLSFNLVDWRLEGQCLLVTPAGVMYGYDPSSPDNILKIGNVLKQSVRELWSKYPFRENYICYYRQH